MATHAPENLHILLERTKVKPNLSTQLLLMNFVLTCSHFAVIQTLVSDATCIAPTRIGPALQIRKRALKPSLF